MSYSIDRLNSKAVPVSASLLRGAIGGAALALAISTLSTPARAFRTARETPATLSDAPVRWKSGRYDFTLNSQCPANFFSSDYESTVRGALSAWSEPSCTALQTVYKGQTDLVAQPGDGVNTIQWISSGWVALGFDPAVPAFTDANYEKQVDGSWAITEADIYINGEAGAWVLNAQSGTADLGLWNILLHEAGHALGLEHPCEGSTMSDVSSGGSSLPSCTSDSAFNTVVMNPDYSASRSALSDDDIAGVCWLYSSGGPCGTATCARMNVCSSDGCHEPCGVALCGVSQSCSSGQCADSISLVGDAGAGSLATANVGEACSADVPCRRGSSCDVGFCVGGSLLVGDPCQVDFQCATGVCLSSGYCAPVCQTTSDCSESDSTCIETKAGFGGCVGALGAMGAACSSSLDCLGNECLQEDGRAPICTRQCDGFNRGCPNLWYCSEYDGQKVCSPTAPAEAGCGCRLIPQTRRSGSIALFCALISLFSARRRRAANH